MKWQTATTMGTLCPPQAQLKSSNFKMQRGIILPGICNV